MVDDPRATRLGVRAPPRDEEALLTGELRPDPNHKQSEVLVPLAKRYTNREIAGELHVSPNTVKTHVRNVLKQLGLKNRQELSSAGSLLRRELGIYLTLLG